MGFLNDMSAPYAKRKEMQAPNVTNAVIAASAITGECGRMLEKGEFLRLVEERAKSRAEIARVMRVAAPRVTELYKGDRDLGYDEAVRLSRHYKIDDDSGVSVEKLRPVLAIALRHLPPGELSDQDVLRLSQEIEYGLSLLQGFDAKQANRDVLDLAERVIADRLQHMPSPKEI